VRIDHDVMENNSHPASIVWRMTQLRDHLDELLLA